MRDPDGIHDPQALLCTNLVYAPTQIVSWFVLRWQLEVTFQEVRVHLGVETQRQWSDLAIARTTPILFGLFSWITAVAHVLHQQHEQPIRQAAWYSKQRPTFSDAIGWVRHLLWRSTETFSMSPSEPDIVKIHRSFIDRLVDTACYAT